MKGRWLINLILLIVVLFTSFFVWNILQKEPEKIQRFEISSLRLANFDEIQIDFPSRVRTHFKVENSHWRMISPYNARADELYVYRILSLLATSSSEKLSSSDLSKYGLDKPRLKITFSNKDQKEVFLFGTYNPINEEQYIKYKEDVYLVSGGFSETASFVAVELIDKKPIASFEKINGFDFSRLEQWQTNQLKLVIKNNKWLAQGRGVDLDQVEILDWFDIAWENLVGMSVEPYEIDARVGYKSFDIILDSNKKLTFYRIQESPELTLFRKDEGLLYHFKGDLGFTMLNPHVRVKDKE